MKVITATNIKGGCGKTTNILHLAIAAAKQKKQARTLAIDLDPQANLTYCLMAEPPEGYGQYIDSFLKGSLLSPIETPIKNLSLVPSHMELTAIQDSSLLTKPAWEQLLMRALRKCQDDFDYVLIDTPAAYFKLHTLALRASDAYIISMRPEAFSYLGFNESRKEIEGLKNDLEIDRPRFMGYFLNGVPKAKRKAIQRIREEISEKYINDGFEIPQSSLFDEARWSEGGTLSVFSIPGTKELQNCYLNAWKQLAKKMGGL
jgi:chromosome partitioning protein